MARTSSQRDKKLAKLVVDAKLTYDQIGAEIGVKSELNKRQSVYNSLQKQTVKSEIAKLEAKMEKKREFSADFAREKFLDLASSNDESIQLGATKEVARYTMVDGATQAQLAYNVTRDQARLGNTDAQALLNGLMDRLRASSMGQIATTIEHDDDTDT